MNNNKLLLECRSLRKHKTLVFAEIVWENMTITKKYI